jgi:hypothetical protein
MTAEEISEKHAELVDSARCQLKIKQYNATAKAIADQGAMAVRHAVCDTAQLSACNASEAMEMFDLIDAILGGMALHDYLGTRSASDWLKRFGPDAAHSKGE